MIYFFQGSALFLLLLPQLCSSLDFGQIKLENEMIVSRTPMAEVLQKKGHIAHFTSVVDLVELESGTKAVLKPVKPLFPYAAIAEVAAYRASLFLNLNLVPPTVLYVKEGIVGSLQTYIEPSFDLMINGKYEEIVSRVSPEDLANIQLFYFVFGQWDPGVSNFIAVEEGDRVHLVLIDNAAMSFRQKVRYGDHPFVLCFPNLVLSQKPDEGPFPFDHPTSLPPEIEAWRTELGNYLTEEEIEKLCHLKWKPVVYAIWGGGFWRQYGFWQPAYTEFYPSETMKKLQSLTLDHLKEFFHNDWGYEFSPQYYDDILERRDQVVKAWQKYHSN
jgi:hypothetical protein